MMALGVCQRLEKPSNTHMGYYDIYIYFLFKLVEPFKFEPFKTDNFASKFMLSIPLYYIEL